MADDSRNPRDVADMRRLEAELKQVADQLRNELAQARRERADAARRGAARSPEGAAAEEAARRRALPDAGRAGYGTNTAATEPAAARDVAAESNRIADAQERATRAARDRAGLLRQERLQLPAYTSGPLPAERPGGALVPYQYGGAGGGRMPPPPPGGAGAAPPPDDDAARRRAQSFRDTIGGYQRQADAAREAAGAERNFSASMDDSIRAQAAASNDLRRHGALTTEFFEALARGEVTLGEVRYQVGATIAKFAGWTAASVAVFGVLDAVRQFSKGAMDAANGANQLQRYINNVDTSKAQEQFVDLAQHFNLPISDVADAFAKMGQVFHNQDQAFEATKAALYAVKTGQMSVADSTRYLLAIVRGAQLPADRLGQVFDRINQAQNKFGVGISDTTAGVAKAMGTWHAAGGDFQYLTDLITAGAAKTGRSGVEMGTAFQRSAEIIRRHTAQNAKQLAEFGINANAPINQVYQRAFQLVQSGRVRGSDITRLATALSTPQLAGRISPILQDPAFFQRVQRTLNNSAGSAAREWAVQARSVSEEIKRVGVNLQTLGVEFVRAGGAAPLGILLHTLNLALRTTTDLLQVFNQLPAPLREAAVVAAELYGLMRLMGRFGIGPGAMRGGQAAVQERAVSTQRVQTFEEFQRSAAADRTRSEFDAEAARRHASTLAEGSPERLRAEAAAARAAERAAAADTTYALATDELANARRAQAALEANLRRGMTVEQARTAAPPVGGFYSQGARERTRAGFGAGGPAAFAETTPLGVNLMPAAQGAEREMLGLRGTSARVARTAANTWESVSASVRASYTGAGNLEENLRGFRGVSAVLRGFLSDPLMAGTVAFIGAEALKQHFEAQGRKYDQLGRGPMTRAQADALLTTRDQTPLAQQNADQELALRGRQAQEQAAGRPVAQRFGGEITADAHKAVENYKAHRTSLSKAQAELNRLLKEVPLGRGDQASLDRAQADVNRLLQGLGPAHGQPLSDFLAKLPLKDFQTRIQADATAIQVYGFRSGRIHDVAAGYAGALHAARKSPTSDNISRLQAAQQAVDAIYSRIQSDLNDALKYADGPQQAQRALDTALQHARAMPRSRKRSQAIREIYDTYTQNVSQRLDDDLTLARDAQQRSDAFHRAIGQLRSLPAGRQRDVAIRQALQRQYQDWSQRVEAWAEVAAGRESDPVAAVEDSIRVTGREIQRAIEAYGRDSAEVAGLIKRQQDNLRARAEAAVSVVASQGAIAVARQTTAGGRARAQLAADERTLTAMRASGRYKDDEINQQVAKVLADRNDLAQSIASDAKALADSVFDLRESRTTDPVRTAQLELQRARMHLRYARTPVERNQALAEVNKAQRDVVQSRYTARYDDLSFEHDMGRLTDAAYAHQLQHLAATIKGNKQFRRQLLVEAHNLLHQASDQQAFDLNVGDIKLPTVYEIRRAIKGGFGPTSRQNVVNVQNDNKITLTVAKGADVDEVFSRIDQYTGGSLAAAGRNSGLMG